MRPLSPLLQLKLKLFFEVGLLTTLPYFLFQNFPLFKVHPMPFVQLDAYFSFSPNFIWVYQSLYLLIVWRTFTFSNFETLLNFASSFTVAVLISNLFFLFYPSLCVRPDINTHHWLYENFIQLEKPLNAFPSMHVSLVLVTCSFSFKDNDFSIIERLVIVIWTLFIIVSTLYTKQHVLIDVVGGCIVWMLSVQYNWTSRFIQIFQKRWLRFYLNLIRSENANLTK